MSLLIIKIIHTRYATAHYSFSLKQFIDAKYYDPLENFLKFYNDILQSLVLCKQGEINRLLFDKTGILLIANAALEQKGLSHRYEYCRASNLKSKTKQNIYNFFMAVMT